MNNPIIIFDSKEAFVSTIEEKSIEKLVVADISLNILRIDDHAFVFESKCPHQGYPLHDSVITPTDDIVCPFHNYRFNLSTGHEYQSRCRPLKVYTTQYNEKGQLILMQV